MKKYLLFLGVVLFVTGCNNIQQIEPNSKHSQILQKATACSKKSISDAQNKAILKLSNQLISFVKTNQSSNKSLYNKQGKKTYYSFNKHIFNIGSDFLSITPKFIDNTKKEAMFSEPTFCSTTIIDYDLLKQYINLAKKDFNQVKKDIRFFNGKISYINKNTIIDKVLNKDKNVIDEYKKLYNVIKVFPMSKFNLPATITRENMSEFLNAKPYVVIKKDNCLYNQKCMIEAKIYDENPELVSFKWYIDNHRLKINSNLIHYNFKKPSYHSIKVIVKDESNLKTVKTKKVYIKNYQPKAGCCLNKNCVVKNKPLTIKSLATDPENELKKISYNLINLNNKFDVKSVFSNYKPHKTGRYLLIQKVIDKYKKSNSYTLPVRVEASYRKFLHKNMSVNDVERILGEAKRDERIGMFTFSDYAYDYGDYWLLFYSDKLKCIVYEGQYVENKDCNQYREKEKSQDL